MTAIRRAVAFLTPIGGAADPSPGAVAWFPLVGMAIGAALGGWWWLTTRIWPTFVAAALVVAADLALTGMLHFDGLVDSADGLLSHLPPERRLAVMSAPDVGAHAMAVGGVVLLARWASLAAMAPAVPLIAGLWCVSRTLMAATLRTQPYARAASGGVGLASAFTGPPGAGKGSLVLGVVGALALAAAWRPVAGPAAVAAGVVAGCFVVVVARRQLGGYTGDVLGAAGVVCETVGLVVAAARW